jgi:hypothetical protein
LTPSPPPDLSLEPLESEDPPLDSLFLPVGVAVRLTPGLSLPLLSLPLPSELGFASEPLVELDGCWELVAGAVDCDLPPPWAVSVPADPDFGCMPVAWVVEPDPLLPLPLLPPLPPSPPPPPPPTF